MYVCMGNEHVHILNTKLASTVVFMPSIEQPDHLNFFSLYLSRAGVGNASRGQKLAASFVDTEAAPSSILWKSPEC